MSTVRQPSSNNRPVSVYLSVIGRLHFFRRDSEKQRHLVAGTDAKSTRVNLMEIKTSITSNIFNLGHVYIFSLSTYPLRACLGICSFFSFKTRVTNNLYSIKRVVFSMILFLMMAGDFTMSICVGQLSHPCSFHSESCLTLLLLDIIISYTDTYHWYVSV